MPDRSNDHEYRRRALAKIHIAKKELGLSDDIYHDLVRSTVPGKESAADLTDGELRMVLDRLGETRLASAVAKGSASGPCHPWSGRLANFGCICIAWGRCRTRAGLLSGVFASV